MDADPPVDPDDPETIQWRRDATTSRTVWLLWSLGVGTFFAVISIIVGWRVLDLAIQAGVIDQLTGAIPMLESIVVALVAAFLVTVAVLAVTGNDVYYLERLLRTLPVSTLSERGMRRLRDAILGTLVMGTLIVALLIAGRIAARPELLGAGGESPFTGLAAATVPLALIALALATFLRSVGAFDRNDGTLYFYRPDQAVDLSMIEAVSSRRIRNTAIVTLEYKQPDGQYVPGPRRITVPVEIAAEIRTAVGTQRLRFSERAARRLRSVVGR